MTMNRLAFLLLAAVAVPACGDDEKTETVDSGVVGADGAAGAGGQDAGPTQNMADASGTLTGAALVQRGQYLATGVLGCVGCHTPRGASGLDMTKLMSGNDCFRDVDMADMTKGCIASANLTPHETGIQNRTDSQVKDMIRKGERPDGKFLFATYNGQTVMPYHTLGNLSDADADALVAWLRSLPPIDHRVAQNQPPFDVRPDKAQATVKLADLPDLASGASNAESARRGRYLAAMVCVECHSPAAAMGAATTFDPAKAFQGGRMYGQVMMMNVASANLTPDATGLKEWTAANIVDVLKKGTDRMGKKVCSPMPTYANMTDADATDIAHFLLALTPKENMVAAMCAQ